MSKRPRSGAGSPTRRSANHVSTPCEEGQLALVDVDHAQLPRPRAQHLERQRGRVVVAEQQHAAAFELVALVQMAHAGEHGLRRRLDVIEVRQRLRHAREPLAHALERPGPLKRRALGSAPPAARMRSTSRSVTPVRATISAGSLAGERRDRPDAAPVQRRRLEQLLERQRRTVTFFVTVVFFLACVSVIVAV